MERARQRLERGASFCLLELRFDEALARPLQTQPIPSMKKLLLLIALIALAGGGLLAYRAFFGPAPVPRLSDLPPQQQAARRADAQALVGQVEEVARAVKKGEKTDFTITATQAQLNTLLQDKIKIKNSPVSELSARLQPDQLILNGRAKYGGITVPVVINGDLKASNGGLELKIASLKLGGLNAPADWKQKAQTAASDALEKALSGGQKLRFEDVRIEREKLTVSGQTG